MNLHNAKHEITAVNPKQYPKTELLEIAFVGRSNVGKSSTINCLLNRKNLARVGATPGKTRVINFYNVDNAVYFVDLPGYGYAKVSKTEKSSWRNLIETYLNTRENLRLLVHLVDIRHKPSEDDKIMNEWLIHSGIPFIVVATKADKLNKSGVMLRTKDLAKDLSVSTDSIIPFSSVNRTGKDELLAVIEDIVSNDINEL